MLRTITPQIEELKKDLIDRYSIWIYGEDMMINDLQEACIENFTNMVNDLVLFSIQYGYDQGIISNNI